MVFRRRRVTNAVGDSGGWRIGDVNRFRGLPREARDDDDDDDADAMERKGVDAEGCGASGGDARDGG